MPSVTRAKAAESSRQSRRKALERRLVAATEKLVSEGATFTEISVERLAAEAGISRSTFYVHFQDKGDLAKHLARTVLGELRDVSSHWWNTAESAARADLERSIAAIVEVYRRHPATFTAVVETATYDPGVADELQALMQGIIDTTRAAIERGQTAGVMRDVPAAETAAVLSWMVERAGYQLVRTADPATDPKIVSVLTEIIWTTLYR